MNHPPSAPARRSSRRGGALLEVTLGVGLGGMMLIGSIWFMGRAASDVRAATVASQLRTARSAAEEYILSNMADAVTQTTSGADYLASSSSDRWLPMTLGEDNLGGPNRQPDLVGRGYAPRSLTGRTIYGARIRAVARRRQGASSGCFAGDVDAKPSAACFDVEVLTVGVPILSRYEGWSIADKLGLVGGFVRGATDAAPATAARGTGNAWSLPLSYFAGLPAGWAPTEGSIVIHFAVASSK